MGTIALADMLDKAGEVLSEDLPPNQWTDTTWADLNEAQQEAVWTMLVKTYEAIGVPVKSFNQLKESKYRLVMLWNADNDQIPDAFMFYRPMPAGNKMFMSGTDGRKASKQAAIQQKIKLLQTDGWYGELSERPAEIVEQAGIKRIDDEDFVRKVLVGEKIEWSGDGYYERDIIGIGRKRKALYGRPKA